MRTREGEELESRQQLSFLALSLGALCLPARADERVVWLSGEPYGLHVMQPHNEVRDAAPAWWPGGAGDPRD